MNIREAILKAADHIERYPADFNFGSIRVPECGTPGCALGWISHFVGEKPSRCGFYKAAAAAMGLTAEVLPDITFYNRMTELRHAHDWRINSSICASILRLYADKYHPAQQEFPAFLANLKAKIEGARILEDA